jgi:hypothetical protein
MLALPGIAIGSRPSRHDRDQHRDGTCKHGTNGHPKDCDYGVTHESWAFPPTAM